MLRLFGQDLKFDPFSASGIGDLTCYFPTWHLCLPPNQDPVPSFPHSIFFLRECISLPLPFKKYFWFHPDYWQCPFHALPPPSPFPCPVPHARSCVLLGSALACRCLLQQRLVCMPAFLHCSSGTCSGVSCVLWTGHRAPSSVCGLCSPFL